MVWQVRRLAASKLVCVTATSRLQPVTVLLRALDDLLYDGDATEGIHAVPPTR
jgi:hypothetical protein